MAKTKSKPADMVITVCYGKARTWERQEAIAFFEEGALYSGGSEQERYITILYKLYDGDTYCSDN